MITCYFENGDKVGLRHLVVGVIVMKDGKVLLERRGTYKGKPILESGKWAIVGGYMDRDERLSDAAKRETFEETGWTIDNVELFRIVDNPNRPNDGGKQNVSMVFIAKAISQSSSNSEEVTDLKWFDLNELPPKGEIAFDFYDSLELYKKYLKEKFPIPVLG